MIASEFFDSHVNLRWFKSHSRAIKEVSSRVAFGRARSRVMRSRILVA